MKKATFLWHSAAVAVAMLSLTSCSNDDELETSAPVVEETVAEEAAGHTLEISASIGNASTRLAGSETTTGIKLTWELGDKIYLMTSTDGTTWADDCFEFTATALGSDASSATFTCNEFSFPDNTTHVKFVYTPESVIDSEDLTIENQDLSSQTGTIDYVASHLFLESDVYEAASETAVKGLTATMSHKNAVMKVVIPESDIVWGDGYAPTTVTMQLESSSVELMGTANNTITLSNSALTWDDSGNIVANIVVCMDGEIGATDYWVFSTTDALGNQLILATSSAKLLEGGKRYSAPVTFTTGNYFPFLEEWFTEFSGSAGSFSRTTSTLVMDTYGAMGWYYTENFGAALNLSNYKYLVLRLTSGYGVGNQLRMSEISYWDEQVQFAIDSKRTTIDLDAMPVIKDDAGTVTEMGYNLDKSNIALVCFWSYGGNDNAIVFDEISLKNESTGDDEEGSSTVDTGTSVDEIEDTDESAF